MRLAAIAALAAAVGIVGWYGISGTPLSLHDDEITVRWRGAGRLIGCTASLANSRADQQVVVRHPPAADPATDTLEAVSRRTPEPRPGLTATSRLVTRTPSPGLSRRWRGVACWYVKVPILSGKLGLSRHKSAE